MRILNILIFCIATIAAVAENEGTDKIWEQISFPSEKAYCIGSGKSLYVGSKDGLYRKIDTVSWKKVIDKPVRSILIDGKDVYVGLWGAQKPGSFVYSNDDGENWTWEDRIHDEIHSISVKDSMIILGLGFPGSGGVTFSDDKGKEWNRIEIGNYIYSVYLGKNKIYAGGEDGSFYESDYNNIDFNLEKKLPHWKLYSITEDKENLPIVAGTQIFSKTNNNNWESIGEVSAIQFHRNYIASINGLYELNIETKTILSTDFNKNCWGVTIHQNDIYVVTAYDGIWRRKLL